jgi:hypothetical protein
MLFGTNDLAAAAAAVQPQLQAYSSEAGSRVQLLLSQHWQQQQQQRGDNSKHSPSSGREVQLAQQGIYEQLRAQLLPDSTRKNTNSAISTTTAKSVPEGLKAQAHLHPVTSLLVASPTAAAAAAAEPGHLPPRWFQALPRLTQLRVVGCGARGSLPAELSAARQLNSLVLSHNKLTGSLPEQLVQLQVRWQGQRVVQRGKRYSSI